MALGFFTRGRLGGHPQAHLGDTADLNGAKSIPPNLLPTALHLG